MNLIDQLLRKPEPTWFENASGREGTFDAVAVCEGRKIAVLGTALARDGVAFVSNVEVRGAEIPLTFTIRRRTIPSRVRIIKGEAMQASMRVLHRYYCSFTALAADDWDAIVRYVEDIPEPMTMPRGFGDDAHRAVPERIQRNIVEQLVQLKRLGMPAPGTVPLIRMQAGPPKVTGDGRSAREVRIHSRINLSGAMRGYDTTFRVYSDDRVEALD